MTVKQVPSWRGMGVLLLVAGMIGLVASFVLTIEKMHLLQDPSASVPCDLNPIISCGSVMKTDQASVFGFANSLLGVAGFAALLTCGIAVLASARFSRWLWRVINGGMLLGVIGVHWLIFQSVYRIGSLCPYCMVVWVTVITTFWYVTVFNLQQKHLMRSDRWDAVRTFITRHHFDVLITWLLLIAAIVLQHFWYYFGKQF